MTAPSERPTSAVADTSQPQTEHVCVCPCLCFCEGVERLRDLGCTDLCPEARTADYKERLALRREGSRG